MSEENKIVDFFDIDNEVEDKETSSEESFQLEKEKEKEENNNETDESSENNEENTEENNENNEESSEENNEENENNEDDSVVSSLMETLGYQPAEDEEYEDSEEGIAKLVRNASQQNAERYFQEQLEQAPVIRDFLQYTQAGGDPTTFLETTFPSTDYSTLEFDENNESQQEHLVRQELVARGYEGEDLKQELEDIKNGGILESKAKRALNSLSRMQQEEKQNLLKQQQQEYQKEQQETQQFWNETFKFIDNTNEIKGMKLPEAEKSSFKSFLYKPVQNGKTQREMFLEEMSTEDSLAVDYMLFKKFNIGSLVDKRAKDQRAKSLRERINKSKLDKQNRQSKVNKKSDGSDIDLNQIF